MRSMTYRELAIKNGEQFYFTHKPCRNGHLSKRYTESAVCVECNRQNSKKRVGRARRNYINKGLGLIAFNSYVHADDLEKAEAFLKALLFDRGIY